MALYILPPPLPLHGPADTLAHTRDAARGGDSIVGPELGSVSPAAK